MLGEREPIKPSFSSEFRVGNNHQQKNVEG